MSVILKNIGGDKTLWAIVALLALFSFLPVYSTSSNLANLYGRNTFTLLLKHGVHLVLGFGIIYGVHKIQYHRFKGLSMILLPVVIVLLGITLMQGTTIGGANASRWIRVPVVGFSFQTSTLASVVLMVYVARYLAKIKDKVITFKESAIELWTPVVLVLLLIFPANFSTAALIFSMVLVLVFLGGYPLKYIGVIIGSGMIFVLFFFITAKAFPDAFPNRVDTWISRIENFSNGEDTKDDYQIERAKTAIASGRLFGLGPGKSVQKNFLPQSSSDFIYAIIVEEWGLVVGVTILLFYLLLLFRLIVILNKSDTFFGKLLVVGVGLPIVFQALINMAVAVELFPVTGQTLPLISSGGTSIWMTCLAIGIILSVSSSQKKGKEKTSKTDNPLDVLRQAV
ncbi:MAG: FtsW/RodA/SpoVE family cell cycle protein [Flavobacteriaceae bacterium]|nr:FtsW/RodA/SpoVE family cell cycle protein [Flavobacteriaceae bacterium]